jgi:AcrR family transcriptional regulator
VYRIKRNAVLQEATRTFGRFGYHDTSLDDIAAALQVSKGTLYNYVKDKQELLFECHRMALDIGDQAFAYADALGQGAYGKLRLMLRAYLTWLNGAFGGGGIAEVTALRKSDRAAIIRRRDAAQARLVGYFEEGMRDGSLRKVDARLAVYTIMGAVNAVQSWYLPKGRLGIDEIASAMVDLLLRGLGTSTAPYVDPPVPPFIALEQMPAPAARAAGNAPPKRRPKTVKPARRARSAG